MRVVELAASAALSPCARTFASCAATVAKGETRETSARRTEPRDTMTALQPQKSGRTSSGDPQRVNVGFVPYRLSSGSRWAVTCPSPGNPLPPVAASSATSLMSVHVDLPACVRRAYVNAARRQRQRLQTGGIRNPNRCELPPHFRICLHGKSLANRPRVPPSQVRLSWRISGCRRMRRCHRRRGWKVHLAAWTTYATPSREVP